MSLVDLDEVPEEKSSRSTSPTRSPRVEASRATPQPVAPPPMTRTSRGLTALDPIKADSWTARDGTAAKGSAIFCFISVRVGPGAPRSLEAIEGLLRTVKYAPPATAATAPIRRRRIEAAMTRNDDQNGDLFNFGEL